MRVQLISSRALFAYVERGKVWARSSGLSLQLRAKPLGKPSLPETKEPALLQSVRGLLHPEVGIVSGVYQPPSEAMNRERELGLDRRETG